VMDSCPASYGACYCNGVLLQDLLYQHLLHRREKARATTQVAQERRAWARQTVTTFLFDGGLLNGTEVAPRCIILHCPMCERLIVATKQSICRQIGGCETLPRYPINVPNPSHIDQANPTSNLNVTIQKY
jgi:hypothetical protein